MRKLTEEISRAFQLNADELNLEQVSEQFLHILSIRVIDWPAYFGRAIWCASHAGDSDARSGLIYDLLEYLDALTYDGAFSKDDRTKLKGIDRVKGREMLQFAALLNMDQRRVIIGFLEILKDELASRSSELNEDESIVDSAIRWWNWTISETGSIELQRWQV